MWLWYSIGGKFDLTELRSWIRKEYFNSLSDYCAFSSLIVKDSFLKVSYNVGPETLSMNFPYTVALSYIGLSM